MISPEKLLRTVAENQETTLVIGSCSTLEGGCIGFGGKLSARFETDLIEIDMNGKTKVKRRHDDKPQTSPYKQLVLTGCGYSQWEVLLPPIRKAVPIADYPTIYSISTPRLEAYFEQDYPMLLFSADLNNTQASAIKLVTTGFSEDPSCLGLPVFPNARMEIPKLELVSPLQGLIYLGTILMGHVDLHMTRYLTNFCQMLKAKNPNTPSPHCIIVSDGSLHSALQRITEQQGISAKFSAGYSKNRFLGLIQLIAKENGLFGCCGGHSTQEALALKANLLFFNHPGLDNNEFTQRLYQAAAPLSAQRSSDITAMFHLILDSSQVQSDITYNEATFQIVQKALQGAVQKGVLRFDSLMEQHFHSTPAVSTPILRAAPRVASVEQKTITKPEDAPLTPNKSATRFKGK